MENYARPCKCMIRKYATLISTKLLDSICVFHKSFLFILTNSTQRNISLVPYKLYHNHMNPIQTTKENRMLLENPHILTK